MEIKNKELIKRINNVCASLGIEYEQLISLLLVSEEVVLPSLKNIEEVVSTELLSRTINILSNTKAIRSHLFNLHSDAMDTDERAVMFVNQAGEVGAEFVKEFGVDLLTDQPFFMDKSELIGADILLDKDLKSLLDVQCNELGIGLSDIINHLLRISSNVPLAVLRLEKLFSIDLVASLLYAQAEIEAIRVEMNGLHSLFENNPEKAILFAQKATEHGFKSVMKKNKLEE